MGVGGSERFVFVALSTYVTKNMKNCIIGICNNGMRERDCVAHHLLVKVTTKVRLFTTTAE